MIKRIKVFVEHLHIGYVLQGKENKKWNIFKIDKKTSFPFITIFAHNLETGKETKFNLRAGTQATQIIM